MCVRVCVLVRLFPQEVGCLCKFCFCIRLMYRARFFPDIGAVFYAYNLIIKRTAIRGK